MSGTTASEVQLHSQLNQAGIVARRDDAAEISCTVNLSSVRIDTSAGGSDRVEVADRVRKIHMIEKVEELDTKLDIFKLAKRKAFED
jgi:hypothetical protein